MLWDFLYIFATAKQIKAIMNKLLTTLLLVMLTLTIGAQKKSATKPRVLISTDIGGTDPDDNQSLAHLLMYSEMFDLEGLVSSPSFGSGSASEIYRMIDVYEKDLPKLKKHVKGLMTPKDLRKLVKQGRTDELPPCGYGEPTEGSARRPQGNHGRLGPALAVAERIRLIYRIPISLPFTHRR
jgi:hypothetical protein